ncbi:hypothetical protein evm_006427 [Chilo suppressalis]|nr:hypothetical protein evm_006427 [Chilo suppressalis]
MDRVFYCLFLIILCGDINGVISKKHGSHQSQSNNGNKIVGGSEVSIQDVPYQVLLRIQTLEYIGLCGGSIISSRVILTAAHCLSGGVVEITIRAGSSDSENGGKVYTTSRYRIHPQYNHNTFDYDVGIVRTLRAMTLDGVNTKAVALPAEGTEVPAGTNVLVSGWGDTEVKGKTSQQLLAVKVPTVSTEDCRQTYAQLTERMFCAGTPEGGKDSCQGDSGGPAVDVNSGVQIGIVSYGNGCARPGVPGVYTNISSIRIWIKNNAGV